MGAWLMPDNILNLPQYRVLRVQESGLERAEQISSVDESLYGPVTTIQYRMEGSMQFARRFDMTMIYLVLAALFTVILITLGYIFANVVTLGKSANPVQVLVDGVTFILYAVPWLVVSVLALRWFLACVGGLVHPGAREYRCGVTFARVMQNLCLALLLNWLAYAL